MLRSLALFLLAGAALQAQVPASFCVKADGTTPAGCVSGNTYTTVTAAIAAMKAAIFTAGGFIGGLYTFSQTETINVYNGTYTDQVFMATMAPTASFPLIVTAATGQSPAWDCGGFGGSGALGAASPYITVAGMAVSDCSTGMGTTAPATNTTFTGNTITNCTIGFYMQTDTFAVNHNVIVTQNTAAGTGGIGVNVTSAGTNGDVSYNEIAGFFNGIQAQTSNTNFHDNLVCCSNALGDGNAISENGGGSATDTVANNVTWGTAHNWQEQDPTIPVNFSHNITVNSGGWNMDYEGGAGVAFHNVAYLALNTEMFSGIPGGNAQYYANASVVETLGLKTGSGGWTSDYNDIFLPSGGLFFGTDGATSYATLSLWTAGTGFDAHSLTLDPRFVNAGALNNTSQYTCTGCSTIEAKLASARRQYIATNLALKGRGCAWGGSSCAADGSDIGANAITVFNSPGANMSASVSARFSGGCAF